MRRSKFDGSWAALKHARANKEPDVRALSDGISVNLAQPCLVLGGRNGARKTRVLRSIADLNDVDGILIDLYYLAEQALIILRSRVDFDVMAEEYTPLSLNDDTTSAVSQIVGREYDLVEWYSFEVEPSDPDVAQRFCWSGEQSLIPYFRVARQGLDYTSRDMGLGEFCVHFLFWILEQYREEKSVTLLLDEPDAYLPSVGVSTLLQHILRICLSRNWSVVLTTHSEEMIRQAREQDAFMLLRLDSGAPQAIHCKDDPGAGNTLLASPPFNCFYSARMSPLTHLLAPSLTSQIISCRKPPASCGEMVTGTSSHSDDLCRGHPTLTSNLRLCLTAINEALSPLQLLHNGRRSSCRQEMILMTCSSHSRAMQMSWLMHSVRPATSS